MHNTDDDICNSLNDLFGGALAIPRARAFKALGVGRTRGLELIKEGELEVLDLGPRTKPIKTSSVLRLLRSGRRSLEPA